MKRISLILLAISLTGLWALVSLGQRPSQDQSITDLRRHLEQRHELHRRMMDRLFEGFGDEPEILKEFEQMFEGTGPSFGARGVGNFSLDWEESKSGRTLIITPASKGQELDIKVDGQAVTVKGKSETKSEYGSSLSSFSNSFPVPEDCDASKVKIEQDKDKILVFFPFSGKASSGPVRRPLPRSGDEVAI